MSSFNRIEKKTSVFFVDCPKMMQQVYKTLPDDDPILSLCVVEDAGKCPQGYCVVNRTHDQDSDADLYRQSVLFGKRPTRYLCLSKVHGIADLIVESVTIVGEKDLPPPNFCTIPKTMDSELKAWRKSQLCFRMNKRSVATTAITDIILLSRMKKAPEGFRHAGEINGLTLCYKLGPAQAPKQITRPAPPIPVSPNLGYSLNPISVTPTPPIPAPRRAPAERALVNGSVKPPSPVLTGENGSPHEYERLITLAPLRPAPKPPGSSNSNYATLSSYQGLEGVPFKLHDRLSVDTKLLQIPNIKFRNRQEINKEFSYDFKTEREAEACS